MRFLVKPLLFLGICLGLSACLDHRGFPPANPQKVRLKRVDRQSSSSINFPPANTSRDYQELAYDGIGRFSGLMIYSQIDNKFVFQSRSEVTYDDQGRLDKEAFIDAPGSVNIARTYTYQYDAQSRVQSITNPGQSYITLRYDSQNRIVEATTYFLDDTSDINNALFISTNAYELDATGNVLVRLQTFISKRNPSGSFRRRNTYTYDQGANPYYNSPSLLYKAIFNAPDVNSPNNVVTDTLEETSQLTGPFPANPSYKQTFTRTLEYQDGLLIKRTNQGQIFSMEQYQYENY